MTKTVHRSATSLRRRSAVVSLLTALALLLTNFSGALAAISFDSATGANNGNSGGTSITIARPATVNAGDLLVAQIAATRNPTGMDSSFNISVPAGWTLARSNQNSTGNNRLRQDIFYRIATDSEPATYSWNFTGSGTDPILASGSIRRYTGVDTTSPLIISSGTSGSGTNYTSLSVDVPAGVNNNDALLIVFFAKRDDVAPNAPLGLNNSVTVAHPNTDGASIQASDKILGNAPLSTDSVSSTSNPSAKYIAQQVVFRKADALPPTPTIAVAAGQNNPTNASTINFTLTFDESINVSSLINSDISFTGSSVGGTLSASITENAPNNGTSFNIAVSGMSGVGDVIVSLPGGAVNDLAGNANVASNSASVSYDGIAPTVAISSSESYSGDGSV
jgi:hypothetical protein